jgi:hypothetical protein
LKVSVPILLSGHCSVLHAFAIWIAAWDCFVVDCKQILYFSLWYGGRIVDLVQSVSWAAEELRFYFQQGQEISSPSYRIQTALCPTIPGFIPQGMKLSTHSHLVLELRMHGTVSLLCYMLSGHGA